MIYVTAATSGPSLRLLKGCPSSSRRSLMRRPCVFGSAAAPLRLATLCSQLKRGRYGLAAAQTRYAPSQRCARLQSGLQSKFAPAMRPQNTFLARAADFENPPPTSATSVAKNLCARSPISHQFGKTGGCFCAGHRRRLTQPSKQQHIALNQSTARPCADSQTSRLASLLSCQDT